MSRLLSPYFATLPQDICVTVGQGSDNDNINIPGPYLTVVFSVLVCEILPQFGGIEHCALLFGNDFSTSQWIARMRSPSLKRGGERGRALSREEFTPTKTWRARQRLQLHLRYEMVGRVLTNHDTGSVRPMPKPSVRESDTGECCLHVPSDFVIETRKTLLQHSNVVTS